MQSARKLQMHADAMTNEQ